MQTATLLSLKTVICSERMKDRRLHIERIYQWIHTSAEISWDESQVDNILVEAVLSCTIGLAVYYWLQDKDTVLLVSIIGQ